MRVSVILAADDFPQIERYARDLVADPIAPDAELVLVGPVTPRIEVPADVRDALGGVQVLERIDHRAIHHSRLAGARVAQAPVVLLAETHAWPAPGTIARLAAAVEDGAAVAGPLMENANPATRRSAAAFLLDYGRWWQGIVNPATLPSVPGHSCAWRRDLILERGVHDPEVLRLPFILAERLRDEGHPVALVAGTRTDHLNADKARSFVLERLSAGRFYGSERCRGWSATRRAVYAAGSVLIPPLRLSRIAQLTRTTPEGRAVFRRAWPALVAATVIGAIGEQLGYVTGRAMDDLEYELELAKARHAKGPPTAAGSAGATWSPAARWAGRR
jgi:hypothetical protein